MQLHVHILIFDVTATETPDDTKLKSEIVS